MSEKMELPKGWEKEKVKNVAVSIQYGYTESSSKDIIGPKFLRITDIQDFKVNWNEVPYCAITEEEKNKYLLQDGDLVFARTGATVGKSFLIKGNIPESIFASYLIRLRFPKSVNDKYVWYYFLSPIYWLQIIDKQVGTGQPNVNGTKLGHLEIIIAPLPEQHRIVAKIEELFSSLDKGIESLKTAQAQLKTYRQAVLKWAFEGKFTNENIKEGELPECWKWVKLGDIAEVFIGSTPSRKNLNYWNGEINWISSGEVSFCNIYATREKITQQGLQNSSCKIHPPDTVIIAMIGEGKTRGQAAILKVDASHNQNTAAIRLSKAFLPKLLYYYFVYTYEKNRGIGSGNNQKALNKERVKFFDIPLSPLSEQYAIVAEIEKRLSVCDKMEDSIAQSLKQAEALRQSILKKAFEGKLVPQDPNDEPASVLLERIKAEKEKSHPAKKTKKS
ncbi:MAG: restriction endonuclease subunit S [Candidatus Riflebacteria bacterium]|nr:restriction endonuclease subunit S [Candidatus Riflebacteria bacterium]